MFDDYTTIAFETRCKAVEPTQGKAIKTLKPKQILQTLPIALAQIKAGNTSGNLLNELKLCVNSYILCNDQKKFWRKCLTI